MGKKMWKKFLPITMAVVIFATSLPMDTLASTVSQNTVTQPEPPVNATVVEAETATSGDLLDGTTIVLNDVTLKATYKEEGSTTTTIVDLVDDGTYELPYNADINMRLNFTLGDGNAIEGGKTYTYNLPTTIRVDVDAEHELEDGTGKSIGKVQISKDGTISFQFYEEVLANNKNVDFYVQFEGGLSEDLQEAGKEADITFPTASGDFNIKINTTDSTEDVVDPEPKDISIQKSGAQIVDDGTGQKMIEWTVELGPEGRDTLDGTLVDVLPNGLQYVEGSAVLLDAYEGSISTSCDGQNLKIEFHDVKTYYHARVKFRTTYEAALALGTTIDSTTDKLINNEAIFNPSDGTTGVTDEGTALITADVLSKSGSAIDADGNITWTVVLNREGLDIQGTTVADTIGAGMEMVDGSITMTPSTGGTLTSTDTGYTIVFPTGSAIKDTYTITYKTSVTDMTMQSYVNDVTLNGTNDEHYFDVSKEAVVPGLNLLDKSSTAFNTVTNTLTWTITVNSSAKDLTNVVVTDTFDPGVMEFISASEALGAASDVTAGELVFNFDSLSEAKTITVVTRIVNPESYDPTQWYQFVNHATLTSDNTNVPITDSADRWTQVKEPELMSKSGQIKGGVIEWTVTVNEPQLTVEGIDFADVLPEDTEYVEGTFRIQNMWYDANPLYREPTVTTNVNGRQQISYTLDKTNEAESAFFTKAFQIIYHTKVTDIDKAATTNTYTNGAKVSIEYEGDITVDDDVQSTVEGIVGGVIDKTYTYKTGDQTVEWEVAINQGRNDMSTIQNPKITDQLADYFDYVDGTLYLVDTKGNKTEVAADDYIVSVVNNKLIVQLPRNNSGYYLGDNCYVFRFTTRFNVLAAELEGKKITNTVDFQGSGESYTTESNELSNVSFSSSSAGAVVKREIRVKKVDEDDKTKVLSGAKFELYLGTECIGEATSGSDGFAVFEDLNSITGYTVTLKEVQAPDGYVAVDTETQIEFTEENLKTENGIDYYEIEITNSTKASTETGNINIEKVDTAGNLLPGAVFGLYEDASCTVLLDSRTATDGTVSFSNLAQATYYVKEISSPAGYKASDEIITVVISNDGNGVTVTYTSDTTTIAAGATKASIINEKATANLKLIKQDSNNVTKLLAGATFSIYKDALCTDRVDTQQTNANGELTFSGLELGRTYYYRETVAPSGYILDTTIYEVTIGDGTEVTDQTREIIVKNTEALGNIVIHKIDNSATPVPLEGVEFGLYESNGTTPIKNSNGNDYVVRTDGNGVAAFNNIPFGDYIVREINGVDGYLITATDTNVTIKAQGDTEVIIINEKIYADIQIYKEGSDGINNVPLAGAEFGLYTDKGVQVTKGTTGDDGKLVFHDIPYGIYYMEELKAPDGYNIDDAAKRIDITESAFDESVSNSTGIIAYSITNDKQNGGIEITKVDAQAQPLGGAEFTLYDENMIQVNLNGVTNPATSADGTGIAAFAGLPYGTYYVQETKAPDGYVRDTGIYKVVINADGVVDSYTKDDGTTAPLEIVNIQSDAPYISFKVMKTDSETGVPLANAVFELYKNGQPCTPAITAVTGADGIAYFRRVQVKNDAANTIYSVHEVAAPTGYKIKETAITLGNRNAVNVYGDPLIENDPNLTDDQILWAGGTNVLTPTGEVENDPLKGTLKVTKTALTSSTLLAGAEFTLYDENRVAVNIAGVTNPAVTDANGIVTFRNLPVGIYYLKETKPPKGYTINVTETRIVVTDETVQEVTYRDTPINVSISKKAVGGDAEIPGAVFKIYKKSDPDQKTVDSWTTAGSVHRVLVGALEIGETYVLTEMTAPAGYGYMPDQEFTVNEDGSITTAMEKTGQTLVVRDRAVEVAISKQDADSGAALAGAILGIYDENGTEVDRFTSNTTSYDVPVGKLTVPAPLAAGDFEVYKVYTIKEISAPDGYQLAEDIKFAVRADGTIHSVSETGGVISYSPLGDKPTIVMQDEEKPSGTIYIRKLNERTGVDISGARLSILDGATETLVVSIDSNGKPTAVACGNGGTLEFNKEYILRETVVPDGYMIAGDIRFSVADTGEITIIQGSADNLNADKDTVMMRDKEIELKIRKQDSFGQVLNGAVLTVSEYNRATGKAGTEIVKFTSGGGTAQDILSKDLEIGKTYILHEVSAPDGYKKAADIIFEIKDDGSLVRDDGVPVYNNTIVMEDDEAGLSIGKISLNTNQGLAGSTLELTTVDDPYFTTETWVSDGTNRTWDLTDFTPGCTYVLTELKAPLGYALTDPIVFTIDADDHQIYINGEKADNRTVHIADGKLELAVNKLDFYSKENVKGAKLGIYDDSGNLITSWTSGAGKVWVDTSQMVVQANGYQEYILREIEAPTGYKKADDIRFAFDRDGKVYLVNEDPVLGKQYDLVDDKVLIMYDTPYIRVEKVDTDGNPVIGARLEVSAKDDASFTPVTWVTTGEAYWFADGTFKEGVTYVLKELEAPAGYIVAEDIEFTVDADENLYVGGQLVPNKRIVMIDQRSNAGGVGFNPNATGTGVNANIPKTGDGTPLGTLMLFATFGLFGACMTFGGYFIRKRRERQ